MPWDEISVVLRATSAVRTRTAVTEKTTERSPGLAILTGGAVLSRTVERTTNQVTDEKEQSIYVYASDGSRAVLRDRAMDFRCLGAAMQPVRMANMNALARVFRERARKASYDERLTRIGTRSLPFVFAGETHFSTASVSTQRVSTAPAVDVLAEILRRGFEEGWIG
jgi:hypothetical protein